MAHLKSDTFALTFLLALMTALGSIATDIYVPSLPELAHEFGVGATVVQWTLSAYLIGFAVAQIFYGPLSDLYGRKPVLLIGFGLFIAATAACIAAPSMIALIAARAVQGVGAAGPIIVVRAIVRDLYEGPRAGREMSVMSTIMGLSPVAAPLGGGVLALWFDWRASFVATLVISASVAICAALLLPETLRLRAEGAMSLRETLASFRIVFANSRWRVYSLLNCFGHTGLFTFISASPLVLQNLYRLTPLQFGIFFAICSATFVVAAWIGSRLVVRRGLDGTMPIGIVCFCIGGVLQALGVLLFPLQPIALLIPEMIYFAGVGFVMPHSIAASLAPFPERAGAAASLQGFLQMSFSACLGLSVSALLGTSAWPLVGVTLFLGGAAAVTFLASAGIRTRR